MRRYRAILSEISRQYSANPRVQRVYLIGHQKNVYRLKVFTDNQQYDDHLMSQLLDIEMNLMDRNKDTTFGATYIGQANEIDYSACIPSGAPCLFQRLDGVNSQPPPHWLLSKA